jgi:DNA-binding beta-propeller fold protein YncE
VADSAPVPLDAACDPCAPTPVFVNAWGGVGTGPGQFVEPSSVELDSTGVVIVAGHEDRVQRFTQDGELIDIFGSAGSADGYFNHPHGLAVDRQRGDLLYVGDQENHRLQVFSPTGEFVRQWGDEKFQHIHDVGIDQASGNLYVGDLETHLLRKFSPSGEILGEYGGLGSRSGQFNGIWGVSTDSFGHVYVADSKNQRVQKLDSDGNFVLEWNGFGGTPFIKPTGIYVDSNDTVYVCDSLAQLVLLFDVEGKSLGKWDLEKIYGERSEPEDIVIDADGKHIYVAEVYRHRVLHLLMP